MNNYVNYSKKTVISLVVAMLMVLAMMPGMAFAAEGDATTGSITGTISAPDTVYIGAPEILEAPTWTANGNAHIDWSVVNGTGAATISKHNGQLVGSAAGTVTVTATLVSGVKTSGSGSGDGTGGNTPCEGTTLATATKVVTIATSNAYGYQGEGGNTLLLSQAMGADVSVVNIGTDSLDGLTLYKNKISGAISGATGTISFGYTMSAGINNFQKDTFAKYADQIGIYTTGGDRVADIDYGDFANRIVTINADVSSLSAGSYILRFGPDVCGNNTSKKLNCYIDFQFRLTK
ncbi:hypothetical protein LI177_06210 [bacterium 210820-DFI.6.37]|nr:hypothetical protein [bacterium 210820-DFI.6.37]